MTSKKKSLEPLLFSFVGVAIMLGILVAIYIISTVASTRIDLTKEKLFTLSEGTRQILRKVDTPVEIRFYATQGKDMPVDLKSYAQRIEDLLKEYKKAAKGNIEIKKLDPQPDSDAEDSANLDGVQGQALNFGDKIYLGLAVSLLDSKVALPFLPPDRERLLEYDLSRAISRVITPQKPTIGVMSGLPVFGAFNPMMMRMGQAGRQEPWIFINELKSDFEVKEVQVDSDHIDDDIKVLVVIHPKGITDRGQYALDQFVLRGGKLIAFVDPHSFVDSRNAPQNNPLQATANSGSSLDKLFKAWGVEFDQSKVLADKTYVSQIGGRGGQPQRTPTVLSLTQNAMDKDDVVTGEVGSLLLPYAGALTGTPAAGLKSQVLLKSSANSALVEKFLAELAPDQDFAPAGKEYSLAIRLTGKFKTAFPEGKPKDAAPPAEDDKAPKKEEPAGDSLKESKAENAVVVVGDADMLFDGVFARVQEVFGQRLVMPFNGNLTFAQNIVEQFSGDSNLISVRSRATMNRPFTVVRDMQAKAEERFRTKIKDLEKSLSDAQTRLNELQKNKDTGQRFILSPEQQTEIQKFQQREAEVKKDLKRERRNLRKDIDSLENRLKWANIALMPFVVAVTGIGLALYKRKRTAAK